MLLLPACSDYALGTKDGDVARESAETGVDNGVVPPGPECPAPREEATAIAQDEACRPAPMAVLAAVIDWENTGTGPIQVTPVVGHLNDDDGDDRLGAGDVPDVVVVNTSGGITAMRGDGSRTLWVATFDGTDPSTPAIGDVNGDGFGDLVVSGGDGAMLALNGRDGEDLWRTRVPELGRRAVCGAVGLYDLDGDGAVEVVQGNVVLDGATGSVRGTGPLGAGTGYTDAEIAAMGVAADIDQDGDQEVVVGNALYGADGRVIWSTDRTDGWVAVANFDDDPAGEIVVSSYPDGLRLQDDDGTVLWADAYAASTIGPPTVADFDGDGEPEIGVAGQAEYVVVDTDGTELWSAPIQDASSGFATGVAFDFEGDGRAEVVYADEVSLWVFDGATGRVKLEEPAHSSATCSESPAVADVDNDGHAEILYASAPYTDGSTGVTVLRSAGNDWRPAREVWNQHGYAITNVDEDTSIPTAPMTNWPTYNSFRSGDLLAGGTSADAVPGPWELCPNECDDGRLYVTVRVGNAGLDTLAAGTPWTLYSEVEGRLVEVAQGDATTAVPPGWTTAGTTVELRPDQAPEGVLVFVVDDRDGFGVVHECREDNNVLRMMFEGC